MSEHDDWAEINRLEAENARLRAELAAEREANENLRVSIKMEQECQAHLQAELAAERYALRAELAAANDMKRRMTDACEEVNKVAEQYRAELAAERESATKANLDFVKMLRRADALEAERDTLRALLREAYPHVWPGERALADSLRTRIDALLNKGGGDG